MQALEPTVERFIEVVLTLHRERGISMAQAKAWITAIMGEPDVARMKEVIAAVEGPLDA